MSLTGTDSRLCALILKASPSSGRFAHSLHQMYPLRVCCPSQVSLASGFHDTSFLITMKCDVDIRKDLYVMSCSQVARPFSKGSLRTMNEPTALAPSTMRFKVFVQSRICRSLRPSFFSFFFSHRARCAFYCKLECVASEIVSTFVSLHIY